MATTQPTKKSAAESSAAAADAAAEGESLVPMELDAETKAAIKREVSARVEGSTRPTPSGAAVVYLGHIPHGFYEEQMKGFFSQFGTVSRLRIARNKRTGRSKHYAFVEFKHREVGEVVAKAMNGYLLFSKVLVAKVMSPEEVHPETFKDANRKWRTVDRVAIVRKEHNRARTDDETAAREAKLLRADSAKRRKLAAAGIEYEFGGYAASAAKGQKRKRGVLTTMPPPAAESKRLEAAPEVEVEAVEPAPSKPSKKRKVVEAVEAQAAEAAPKPATAKVARKQKAAVVEPEQAGSPPEPQLPKTQAKAASKPKAKKGAVVEDAAPSSTGSKKAKGTVKRSRGADA